MLTADVLIAPLRMLMPALGTGVLPGNDPVTAIAALAPDLAAIRDEAMAAASNVEAAWDGAGGTAATAAARRATTTTVAIEEDTADIVRITGTAAGRVERAAAELNGLLDSFAAAARALGDGLFTPAGLMMLLPVALDHIERGVTVVARTRAELAGDTRELMASAQTEAPAGVPASLPTPASVPAGPGTDHGGVAITLPDGSVAYAPNERAATAVRAALSQQGVPYVWGGTDPSGFDCSGLTQWAYRQAGLELPRLAQEQDTAGIAVAQGDLLPGDLAVWDGHVAMYIGNNQLVEAGDPVQVSPLRTSNAGQGFQGFFRPR
ncbi:MULTISPECIES: C40 family peptidase [Gordonia]|jgi:cell wall-associated NlpC family hydrolase|uniref:C40 family peptidase n=1 Tax=Gordonia TaxID=2053 RepID=UPI0032B322CC